MKSHKSNANFLPVEMPINILDETKVLYNSNSKFVQLFVYELEEKHSFIFDSNDFKFYKLFDLDLKIEPFFLSQVRSEVKLCSYGFLKNEIQLFADLFPDLTVDTNLIVMCRENNIVFSFFNDTILNINLSSVKKIVESILVSFNEFFIEEKKRKSRIIEEHIWPLSLFLLETDNKIDLWDKIIKSIKPLIGFKEIITTIYSEDNQHYMYYLSSNTVPKELKSEHDSVMYNFNPIANTSDLFVFNQGNVCFLDLELKKKIDPYNFAIKIMEKRDLINNIFVKLIFQNKIYGVQHFHFDSNIVLTNELYELIVLITKQLSIVIYNILKSEEQQILNDNLKNTNKKLISAIDEKSKSVNFISNNANIIKMIEHLKFVAKKETHILITGQTGTGKEIFTDIVHQNSDKKNNLIIKINCAAIPSNLLESEFFGHEKGSFTGATDRKIGKFEIASKGTLMLDEIGELPLDLQAKLLRVLQDKEFERIGSSKKIKTDARIIAVTNRNLREEIEKGTFRMDLYYRLAVIEFHIPPLTQRLDDIELLVNYFIKKKSKSLGIKEKKIDNSFIAALKQYHWPGNVRELENLIERLMLIYSDTEKFDVNHLDLPKTEIKTNQGIRNIDEIQKEYLLQVLATTNGKVYGKNGAAEMLNIPPTTLYSKLKKLGIK